MRPEQMGRTPKVTGSTVSVPFTIDGTYDPASLTCQLDNTAPVPCASTTEHTFTEVAQGDHVMTIEAATTAGAVGQGSSTFTCTLVGGTTQVTHACTSPWTYPTDSSWLAGGKYELSVTVTDSATPAGTATDTATVNVPGPKT